MVFILFFKYVFSYFIILISHHKVFSLPFIVLVEFWFGLILSFFWKYEIEFISKHNLHDYEFEYTYQLFD